MKKYLIPLTLFFTTFCWSQTAGQSVPFTTALLATVTAVKTTGGNVFGWCFFNGSAATAYIQMFNATTANVTLGTTVPKLSVGIPAGQTVCPGPSLVGVRFGTAISIAATTTRGGLTAPASAIDVNFFYD